MKPPIIVLDTNVLVAALRSRRGSSFKLLQQIGRGKFELALSVPLLLEYDDVLNRQDMVPVSPRAVSRILDYLCQQAHFHKIFYLWRPMMKDPKDDMVLELAVHARCSYIVTHNLRDFEPAQSLGVKAITPASFLRILEKQV